MHAQAAKQLIIHMKSGKIWLHLLTYTVQQILVWQSLGLADIFQQLTQLGEASKTATSTMTIWPSVMAARVNSRERCRPVSQFVCSYMTLYIVAVRCFLNYEIQHERISWIIERLAWEYKKDLHGNNSKSIKEFQNRIIWTAYLQHSIIPSQ